MPIWVSFLSGSWFLVLCSTEWILMKQPPNFKTCHHPSEVIGIFDCLFLPALESVWLSDVEGSVPFHMLFSTPSERRTLKQGEGLHHKGFIHFTIQQLCIEFLMYVRHCSRYCKETRAQSSQKFLLWQNFHFSGVRPCNKYTIYNIQVMINARKNNNRY